jgi:hypothetical protein
VERKGQMLNTLQNYYIYYDNKVEFTNEWYNDEHL